MLCNFQSSKKYGSKLLTITSFVRILFLTNHDAKLLIHSQYPIIHWFSWQMRMTIHLDLDIVLHKDRRFIEAKEAGMFHAFSVYSHKGHLWATFAKSLFCTKYFREVSARLRSPVFDVFESTHHFCPHIFSADIWRQSHGGWHRWSHVVVSTK